MENTYKLGDKGEELAVDFLINKGFEILNTNWRFKHIELDIVARDNDKLVFVEVKTRTNRDIERPQDAITIKKQKNIITAANVFIEQYQIDLEVRFDVISIILNNNYQDIEHIKDAFHPMA